MDLCRSRGFSRSQITGLVRFNLYYRPRDILGFILDVIPLPEVFRLSLTPKVLDPNKEVIDPTVKSF